MTSGESTKKKKRKVGPKEVVSLAKTRSRRAPKVPTLEATYSGTMSTDPCGGFRRVRRWTVKNPAQGLIIQHVTRKFTGVHRWDSLTSAWVAMSDSEIDGYVTAEEPYATVDEYWEAWEVDSDGVVSENEDSFALCSIIPNSTTVINTTKGQFTIRGVATFYPTELDAATLGFTVQTDSPAGVIASRDDNPASDLSGQSVTASGDTIDYQVAATWDSRYTGTPTPTTSGRAFMPKSAYTTTEETTA